MKKDYWVLSLSVASWIAVVLLIPRLPDLIPLHWNIEGQVDRWGSRYNIIWMGALGAVIWLLMTFLPDIDPARENYKYFVESYRVLRGIIAILMLSLSWITIIFSMNNSIKVVPFIKIFIGVSLIIIGNLLTRIRPNWFTGIKTPWTLADPVIWKKTHRIGGYLLVIGGISFIVSGFLLHRSVGFWVPIGILLGGAVFDVLYSAVLWRRRHGSSPVNGPRE